MRFFRFLLVLAAVGPLVSGCGGSVGTTDLTQSHPASAEGARAPVSNVEPGESSSGRAKGTVLFACADDRNDSRWPAPLPSTLVVEWLGGNDFLVDGRQTTVTRVDKEGPFAVVRVRYYLMTNDGRSFFLDGEKGSQKLNPTGLIVTPADRTCDGDCDWWSCPRGDRSGVFEDALLDALVTQTGGRRTLVDVH
jgi:hypothetical protein